MDGGDKVVRHHPLVPIIQYAGHNEVDRIPNFVVEATEVADGGRGETIGAVVNLSRLRARAWGRERIGGHFLNGDVIVVVVVTVVVVVVVVVPFKLHKKEVSRRRIRVKQKK